MTAALLAVTRGLIEAWARVYTIGLAPRHRRERIDLVRGDVFEQISDGESSSAALALSLLGRCLRGMADDVSWRLFEARRLPHEAAARMPERSTNMVAPTPGGVFYAVTAGIAWAAVLVLAIEPVPHSMAYAGGLLGIVAMAGWTVEARAAGDDAEPSAWPALLALAIVDIAAGVVFEGGRLGLVAVLPLAAGLSTAFLRRVAAPAASDKDEPRPLPTSELSRHAAMGEAVAIEKATRRGVTRRALLRSGFTLGIASSLAAMGGIVVDFLWQRDVSGFGAVINAGRASGFAPGSKTKVQAGKFWLVNLTAEQGGPGFLALWQKCPHLG